MSDLNREGRALAEKHGITEDQMWAMNWRMWKELASRTVTFVRQEMPSRTTHQCAGVLVRWRDRLLVATCKHCLPGDNERVLFCAPAPDMGHRFFRIIATRSPGGQWPDVGVMEIDSPEAREFFRQYKAPISTSMTATLTPCDPVVVFGAAAADNQTSRVRVSNRLGEEHTRVQQFAHPMEVIPHAKVPNLNPAFGIAAEFAVEYPRGEIQDVLEVRRFGVATLGNPQGLSGAGAWQYGKEKGQFQLVGLVHGDTPSLLRVHHIACWLNLLSDLE